MEGAFSLTLLVIAAIVAGVFARVIANFFRVPSIIFLLLFGIGLGGNGLGWIQPRFLGDGLGVIVSLSVALILFDGGLNLQLRELGKVSVSLRNLVTIGALISLIGGGIAAHWLSEFPWTIAFLYAALVVVTGPTVINPIVQAVGLDRRLATILEGEGVLIDAVGTVLAVVVLNVALNPAEGAVAVVQDLFVRVAIGAGIGGGGGWLLATFLRRASFLAEDTKGALVVATVLGLFGLAQELCSESGIMTVVVAGIVVRAAALPDQRAILKFKSQLTALMVSVLFILLSANLSIPSIFALGWDGVATVLFMMLVVRPINVLVSTWNSSFTWRQKAFMAWCAPRGIVAASVASLFSIVLTERGINGGESIKALVFLTIAMTVFLQGLSAPWVARLLKLQAADASGMVIIGCNPLGILIGRLISNCGQRVTLVDTSAESCKQAQEYGLNAIVSNGLDAMALAEAGLDSVGTLIALTVNTDVNLVLAQLAAQEFNPPQVFAVYTKDRTDSADERKNERKAERKNDVLQAFGARIPIKAWNQYISQQEIRIGEIALDDDIDNQLLRLNLLFGAGILLPLLFERKRPATTGKPSSKGLQIVPADMTWERGDQIFYLLHAPKALPASDPKTLDILPSFLPDVMDRDSPMTPPPTPPENSSGKTEDFLAMAREILKKVNSLPK
ncbi:MAG: cation:proton antiporter [Pseudanabaenaceae cyanobacterium]|jgi:NhaP-type Na+/H+ or K+/H+ antiporter